jgi:hypothetical protein
MRYFDEAVNSDSRPGQKAGPGIFDYLIRGQSEPKITEKQANLSQIWRLAATT